MAQSFNNFTDLGKAFGLKVKSKKGRPFICRKCGEEMKHVPGTNVYLCEGILPNGDACGNRVLTKVAS
jgi:hypothetical protein